MKRCKRGFHDNQDGLVLIALVAIVLAILLPVCSQAVRRASRHGMSLVEASIHTAILLIGLLVIVFVLLPLTLALPLAWFVKRTSRRDERFRDLLIESWGGAVWGLFSLLFLVGCCMAAWDKVILPIIEFSNRR